MTKTRQLPETLDDKALDGVSGGQSAQLPSVGAYSVVIDKRSADAAEKPLSPHGRLYVGTDHGVW